MLTPINWSLLERVGSVKRPATQEPIRIQKLRPHHPSIPTCRRDGLCIDCRSARGQVFGNVTTETCAGCLKKRKPQ